MAKALLGAAVVGGDGHGTLLMFCMVAAILSTVVFGLFGKGRKKKATCDDAKPNKPSNVVIFAGYSCRPGDGGCGNTLKEAGQAGGSCSSGDGDNKGSGCGGGVR